jgi:ribosome maturation protein SDO1
MTNTVARIKQGGKHFEIIVDLDKALQFKKDGSAQDFLEADKIFTNSKKGFAASESDLSEAFGTNDSQEIAEKIVKSGEVLVGQEHRNEEQEKKYKQVVDFLSNNATDPQGSPISGERIKSALEESNVNIKNTAIEDQIQDIVSELSKVIPIKIETKKVKLTIPAVHTGKIYGLINQYKDKEDWLSNGDLEVNVNVPAGTIMDFYDKLNSLTQGSVLTEEIKENG